MNKKLCLKHSLLSSIVALITTSFVHAADAVIVAEPETAEYVKICDVYGAGYFYIPGTETCLRIGGYIRYDAGFGDVGSLDGARTTDRLDLDRQETWKKNARFSFRTWTGQETEYGTLKTYTETRFNFGNKGSTTRIGGVDYPISEAGNKDVELKFAWIQLGGLRVGKDESAYDSFIGYAGNVIQDTLIPYGDKDTNLISYTFETGNGFSAIASLEQGSGTNTIDSYVPHLVGGLKFKADWGSITGVVAYNSVYEEWAGKLRLDVKATSELSLFVMGGYGSHDNIARNFFKPWGGNWAIWGGGTYKLSEKAKFNTQISYDDDRTLAIAANVAYEIVPGFVITPEVDFVHEGNIGKPGHLSVTRADDKNSIGGIIRFQRNF